MPELPLNFKVVENNPKTAYAVQAIRHEQYCNGWRVGSVFNKISTFLK